MKTKTEVADAVGISREHFSRQLSLPHVTNHMHHEVRRRLSMVAAQAGDTKISLLDAESERVRGIASSYVLGLGGIKPAAESAMNVNINIHAGYIIDLSDAPKVIDHA